MYQLRIRLWRDARIRVGGLGVFLFPQGLYVYTGRASRGLSMRIMRYILPSGTLQWHIDYLLACKHAWLEGILLVSRDPKKECAINQKTGRTGRCIVPGFGASDCRARCGTHLWYFS